MGTYKGKTAEEWRAMAQESARRNQESFDRSDTDGALSQWGHGLTEREYRLSAEVAEQDGWWEFIAVFDAAGMLMDAREVQTRYGWSWAINTINGTVWFTPSADRNPVKRYKKDVAKGYRLGVVRKRAWVTLSGGDMFSVRPIVKPDKYETETFIIDDGSAMRAYQAEE